MSTADPAHHPHQPQDRPHDRLRRGVVIGALGVVFGDIGTSPVYTLQTVFSPVDPHPVPVVRENVLGVVSLVVWSVVLIVTITYVLLAMRVDNRGEGGILALITLLRRWARDGRSRLIALLTAAGVFGAALFLGDSMITPAISVLSAVEGVTVVRPGLEGAVVPLTAGILLGLFVAQRFGTAVVGRLFGPVMIAWFLAIGALGVGGITRAPEILLALSPTYAIGFLGGHLDLAFFAMAAVVLAVTGAEALYADMGHFGRRPIAVGWLGLVFPACVLSYLGQGALILDDPSAVSAPFFLLAPEAVRLGVVVLATAATVIASQAVITGAFSVAAQAAQLGYLPRLRVVHTSRSTPGQVYVPWINGVLMVAVLALVVIFQSSLALAYAFGMAVTGTILVTTTLLLFVAWRTWRVPKVVLVLVFGVLLGVDLLFLAANLTKLVHGAWLPLAIALVAFVVMLTWQRGRALVTARRQRMEGSLLDFAEDLRLCPGALTTVPGTAVFLNRGRSTAPLALRANVEHNHVRHEQIVVLAVDVEPVPRVEDADRIVVDDLGDPHDGLVHVTLRFGYAETPDVPRALARLAPHLDLVDATWFLSTIDLHPGDADIDGPRMTPWRTRLFLATSHLTADAAEHFALPRERTVLMGSRVEV